MPYYDVDICETIKDDFLEYAGHVMQERSIPDARDGLKDGARKILYSQYRNKNDYKHNFIKGQAAVGRVLIDGFLHGDASAYSTLVRMGKPYAVPYVLEEIQGNGGNQTNPDSHAAGRYLEIRQSELASYLFHGIEKNAITEWYWNYSNTLELPRVLPTIGFYPIINGLTGISVGLSTSIPSTNLREVNNAIIKLIQNPSIDFEEIYCPPDFPMGGTIINGAEVKESFRLGTGKAVKIRAKIDYIAEKSMLVATEIPFSVYTDTIDAELTELINGENNPGIEKYIDATNDEGARINIYLSKGANVKKIINILYKTTSLESYYGINMIMLQDGRFPKLYTWKNALSDYITHIRICKTNEIQYDLDKALGRKSILEGLIIAAANIDEVVAIIRSSQNPTEASEKLIARFRFNEEQTKAILAMKLSSLTKIDAIKLNDELEEIKQKIEWFQYLLNDHTALDNELIKTLREVADKFGDNRRTKVINLVENNEEVENIQEEEIGILLFDNATLRLVPKEDLIGGKKGRKGTSIKPPKNANLINTLYSTNLSSVAIITTSGRMYNLALSGLDFNNDYSVYELINIQPTEKVLLLIDTTSFTSYQNLITLSKQGYVKKTAISEYNSHTKKGLIAAKLDNEDTLVGVYLSHNDTDKILIATNAGNYNYFEISQVNATGRATRGVKGIKLTEDAYVVGGALIRDSIEYRGLLTIDSSGKGKITPLEDFTLTNRCVKGNQAMTLKNDTLALIYAIPTAQEKLYISANNKAVLIEVAALPIQNRMTIGARIIDTRDNKTKIEIM